MKHFSPTQKPTQQSQTPKSETNPGRGWLYAMMGMLIVAAATLAFIVIRRRLSPHYWTAEDLGPIQTNPLKPIGLASEGMVWVPGGTFWMGSELFPDAQPVHKTYVDGFWMDKTEVNNAQFQKFVEDTGYLTVAEKVPDFAEIMKQLPPGTPPPPKEKLVAGSLVFTPPSTKVPLNDVSQWWKWTAGANWRHPEGPGSDLSGRDKHPVVHIAYGDALAFCAWRSTKEGGAFRLPSEAEWEFAARGGLDRKPFAWGDEFKLKGKLMANTWQGEFPHRNTKEDGFVATAPVGSFPPNEFGLFDMAGNVWEWCADWYHVNYYGISDKRNPQGPKSSHDPNEPGIAKRVHRGGSYLCSDEYCKRYMPGGRGKGDPDSSTNHLGFRCVTTPAEPEKVSGTFLRDDAINKACQGIKGS